MAMTVSTPPSCLRPPPDPPPPSLLGLMQHCSSFLKMMVTALPPPPDPPQNKHFPVEMLSPIKPPEPPDPSDVSVRFVLLRIFVTFSRSSPQATQILKLMFNLSWVLSTLSDGDTSLVVTGDTVLVYWTSFSVLYRSYLCQCSFPVVYRLYLCLFQNGSTHSSCSSFSFIQSLIDVQVHFSSLLSWFPYSFEWDAMLDVRVNRALVGNVLMDSVSFGYIFMSLGGFHVAIEWSLHTVFFYSVIECSLPITSWFQICLTSSRVEYVMVNCRFLARLEVCFVEIRGRLCNVDAGDASRHCDIGGIFSGENTISLPNLCESRNHVSSALMAEAIAVFLAVAIAVYSNVRSLEVLSDSLSLIKLLKNGGFQPKLFSIMFDIYQYLSYFDVISSIFISQNFNGEVDEVAKSTLSLVVTIFLIGM